MWLSSLEICCNLFTWWPTPPMVLTSSGGHRNMYGWQGAVRILMESCLVLVILTKSLLFIADPVIQNYLRIDEERIGDVRPGFPIYHKIAKILCIRCKVGSVNLRNVTNIYHLAWLSNEMYFHVKSVEVDLRSSGDFDTINFYRPYCCDIGQTCIGKDVKMTYFLE